jgi:OmpA-OmpF porin, OOP family
MKKNRLIIIWALCYTTILFTGAIAQEGSNVDWSKFDFVPGDEIIFEDNLEGERNGEFPGKWDLVDGVIENANVDGHNVIMFRKGNINSTGGIVPLMKNSKEDYLPDEFTIEFDAYFDQPGRIYRLLLYDGKNQKNLNRAENPQSNNRNDRVRIYQNAVDYGSSERSYYPGFSAGSGEGRISSPGWRRISISFNKRALKVYLDDVRLLNIPNLDFNPLGITIGYHNTSGKDHAGYIKNIRIAKGAVPLYDKLMTDGKIITTGIRFDVNKSTIKQESMGTINEIVKLMNENPNLNFSVEGHTDSDGSESLNQTLSEARAKTVMENLIKSGISTDRLKSIGHGQSKPIATNDTPEGKAQNRRVEFVQF